MASKYILYLKDGIMKTFIEVSLEDVYMKMPTQMKPTIPCNYDNILH